MSDAASRYARSGITTFLPNDARPENSRILRVAALVAVATGIGVSLMAGYGPDLGNSFVKSRSMHVQGEQALDILRIQAFAAQPHYAPGYR